MIVEVHRLQQTERAVSHVGRRKHRLALIPASAVIIVVIRRARRLASSQQHARADEKQNSEYSRAANAAMTFTMSSHVLIPQFLLLGGYFRRLSIRRCGSASGARNSRQELYYGGEGRSLT